MRIPLAREGYPFILASIFVIIFFLIFDLKVISYPFLAITIFIVAFFRDPEREIPTSPDSIVSPADGKVIKVENSPVPAHFTRLSLVKTFPPLEKGAGHPSEAWVGGLKGGGGGFVKVSIFMSLFDVHVNRIPYDGKVLGIFYNPGNFFSANRDKASLENEQNSILIESSGKKIVVNQIAGLIARRIVCYLKEGDIATKGERFGMIRFGSRLDVYLPVDCRLEVKVGDRVKAGSSVLGYWG